MTPPPNALRHSIVVVGGNGFLGSAVCRRALAKGMEVTSISSSGRPFATPKGHTPAWVHKVKWHAASAHDPLSYTHLLEDKTAVVHTLGILLEGGKYKSALRNGNPLSLLSSFITNAGFGDPGNPLTKGQGEYERTNRDAALCVFETYASAKAPAEGGRTFVYVSAEDIFRPFVPRRYIDSKREAEREIAKTCLAQAERGGPRIRDVFVRPSLMYHAHLRPLTTPLAVLLDFSSSLHHKPPFNLRFPLPSDILRSLASRNSTLPPGTGARTPELPAIEPSALSSIANALEIPPIHVDQVAEAIVTLIQEKTDIRGVVGVEAMREVIGWHRHGTKGEVSSGPLPS